MITHIKIERSDPKETAVTQIDIAHGWPLFELSIASKDASLVAYLTKEERDKLLKELMEPKK